MTRPLSISDDQILEAARAVFLQKGIRATTAEVARRAGVAEGSVFKRFKNKDELFVACMEPAVLGADWVRTFVTGATKRDVRAVLYQAGLETIEFFRQLLPIMMMSWSNRARSGLPPHLSGANPPPLRALKAVAGSLETHMRAGRLKRHDPEILTRVFIASMQNYAFLELVLKQSEHPPIPPEMYVRGVIQLLWTGAAPELPRRKRAR